MRSSLLDELNADYLTTARAKGLRDDLVRRRHAVPNALLPSITLIILNLGFVISGAITIETVFSWPGLGRLTYNALNAPGLPAAGGRVPAVLRRGDRHEPDRRPAATRCSTRGCGPHDRTARHRPGARAALGPAARLGPAPPGAGRVLARVPQGPQRRGRAHRPDRSGDPRAGSPRCWPAPAGSARRCPRTRPTRARRWHYPLGTDDDGRSVLTELIWGARISLLVGFAATLHLAW